MIIFVMKNNLHMNKLILFLTIMGFIAYGEAQNKKTDNALKFINGYVENANKMNKSVEIIDWVNANKLSTDEFKKELKRMIDEEYKNDPELGIGVDPIFDAQDYPEKGFVIESFNDKTNYLILKGIDWPDFRVAMRIKNVNGTWLVDGCGIVNIPNEKQVNRQNRLSPPSSKIEKKYQAKAPATQPFGKEAFDASDKTTVRWLGMSGFLINSRGTTFMLDPLLGYFDMPLLIDFPIKAGDVPHLDAVLITHSDNDHYSRATCADLKPVTNAFHSTVYVDSLMKNAGLPSFGHKIGDSFAVGKVKVTLTPADHVWQSAYPNPAEKHVWKPEDCAGFWMETPDGNIWAPGDSRLMPEHLEMPTPDAILFDFSDSEWHFTLAGAVKLANAYPDTPLLLHHWGTVDAPDASVFNADPKDLYKLVVNPKRIILLAPGEPFTL